jgi:hypothetical protein
MRLRNTHQLGCMQEVYSRGGIVVPQCTQKPSVYVIEPTLRWSETVQEVEEVNQPDPTSKNPNLCTTKVQ